MVAQLPPDDAADVIGELSQERIDGVLENVPAKLAAEIEKLLRYDEHSAGGIIMTPRVIALSASKSVGDAVHYLRDASPREDLHHIYVVDGQQRLVGAGLCRWRHDWWSTRNLPC